MNSLFLLKKCMEGEEAGIFAEKGEGGGLTPDIYDV
jgi:hypothetical protein